MKLPDRFYQMVSINIFKIANRKKKFLTPRILRSKIKDSAVPAFCHIPFGLVVGPKGATIKCIQHGRDTVAYLGGGGAQGAIAPPSDPRMNIIKIIK